MGGAEVQLHSFSTQMEVSGQLHAPAALPPTKNVSTHSIGDSVGNTSGLDGFGEE